MKLVFFLCLLINITFFLWEYRKGAPGIYLPPAFEYSESDAKKIIVLANSPEISAQPIKYLRKINLTKKGVIINNYFADSKCLCSI